MANVTVNGSNYTGVSEVRLPITGSSEKQRFVLPPSGTREIVANGLFDVSGFANAEVNVPSDAPVTQERTVTPTAAGVVVTPDSGKLLSKVTVTGDTDLVSGNIRSGVNIFGVTGSYAGVAAPETQERTVTPTKSGVVVTPDSGKLLSKVTVSGDADLVAENIKSGVNIFGVTGTYVGDVEGGGGIVPFAESGNPVVCMPYPNTMLDVSAVVAQGQQAVKVHRFGKNMVRMPEKLSDVRQLNNNMNVEVGVNQFSGIWLSNGSAYCYFHDDAIIVPGATYTVSYDTDIGYGRILVKLKDSDGEVLTEGIPGFTYNVYYKGFFPTASADLHQSFTFTVTNTQAVYADIGFVFYGSPSAYIGQRMTVSNIQLELGSEATQFGAYTGDTFTVEVPNAAGIVTVPGVAALSGVNTLMTDAQSLTVSGLTMSQQGSGGASLTTLTAIANGTYAPTGYDGYSLVTVAIPTYTGVIT